MGSDHEQPSVTPSVWRRQMRVSSYAVVAGVLLLIYCIPQLRHAGTEHLPAGMVALSVAGGLAVLGGMFSFALALFFHLWHQKRED